MCGGRSVLDGSDRQKSVLGASYRRGQTRVGATDDLLSNSNSTFLNDAELSVHVFPFQNGQAA